LGCHIIRQADGLKTGGIIVEAEAYIGEDDPACHASHGLTERNSIMYGPPGFLYVYFTYGNHFMINVVTGRKGFPAAVLLRGMEPIYGVDIMAKKRNVEKSEAIASGPGKLAAALSVTKQDYGTDLLGNSIYIIGPGRLKDSIMASPRIGIGARGSDKLWRFYLKDNPHVSRHPGAIRENIRSLNEAKRTAFSLYKIQTNL